MKYLIYLLIIIPFISCNNISKDDEEAIKFSIGIKNDNNKLKYNLDFLDKQLYFTKELQCECCIFSNIVWLIPT